MRGREGGREEKGRCVWIFELIQAGRVERAIIIHAV